MDKDKRAHLETLMARMAERDIAAMVTLQMDFASSLRGTVVAVLRDLHRTDVQRDPDEMNGLVQLAALVIYDNASAWRADGALPWNWAYRAIRARVVATIGHPLAGSEEDLDSEANAVGPASGSADLGVEELTHLSQHDERVALLLELFYEELPPRSVHIVLEYLLLQRDGCADSSSTVAAMFDTTPDNVRQIKSRSLKKLRPALATPRYAPLADLPLLAS